MLSIKRQKLFLTNIEQLTPHHKKSPKSPIIIIVCTHCRTVCGKIGSHAKYIIILKYRNYVTSDTFCNMGNVLKNASSDMFKSLYYIFRSYFDGILVIFEDDKSGYFLSNFKTHKVAPKAE